MRVVQVFQHLSVTLQLPRYVVVYMLISHTLSRTLGGLALALSSCIMRIIAYFGLYYISSVQVLFTLSTPRYKR